MVQSPLRDVFIHSTPAVDLPRVVLVTIIAEKDGTLSTAAGIENKKRPLISSGLFIGRPDSANPYVRSALLSEVVSANVIQRIPAHEIVSCSGGDTQKKITRAILRRSAKECDAKNSEAACRTAKLFAAAH
jgi:hypothetical protein